MNLAARSTRAAGGVALLVLGALVLHQLRYLLAYGGAAGAELERQGHAYLELVAPLLVAVAVAALVASVIAPALMRLAPALAQDVSSAERSAGYAVALLAVYFAQELAEGALAAGHPAGLEGVLGASGWLVLPLAMALGAIAAFARGWLYRAERRLAAVLSLRRLPRPERSLVPSVGAPTRRPLSSLGLRFGIARRPPPLASRA